MRKEIRSVIEITVQFHETDMLGIVHNSVFFQWFERGRMDIFNRIISVQEALKQHIAVLVVKNSCNYHAPAHYGDTLILTTRAPWKRLYDGKLIFRYELSNKKSKALIALGETVATLYDIQHDRLIREIPEFVLNKIQSLFLDG